MSKEDEYLRCNRALWDSWTPLHVGSKFYDVDGFKAGRDPLDPVETACFGDVRGKSLLHLQCHFGLSTMAWARRGAHVTGVDFSEKAISAARALASELGLDATFILSDIHDLPRHCTGTFDLVFTSHGVLPWLPDLARWGKVIAHFLKPGGRFLLVEEHPLALTLDETAPAGEIRVRYPYFEGNGPLRFEGQGSYAEPGAPIRSVSYEWQHSLHEILGSLLCAGLTIEEYREYPYLSWPSLPWMVQREDGFWELPPDVPGLPLMFSLVCSRACRVAEAEE
jgi:SAM-dependent methyltransferase